MNLSERPFYNVVVRIRKDVECLPYDLTEALGVMRSSCQDERPNSGRKWCCNISFQIECIATVNYTSYR